MFGDHLFMTEKCYLWQIILTVFQTLRQIRVFVGIFCRSGEPVLYIQRMLGKYGRDYIETLRVGLPIVLG